MLLGLLVWKSIDILTISVEDGLTKRAVTTSRLFADAAKDAVISSDLATLDTLVAELVRNPDLHYVRVIGQQEEVLAQAGAGPDAVPERFLEDQSYRETTDGIYDTSAEIVEGGAVFGRVEIGFSIAPLVAIVESARRDTITIAVAEMALVALFSFILGLYLTRQLRQLKRASRRIAEGEFGYQLEVKGRDELADTANAFNTMSRRISSLYEDATENERRSRVIVEASLDAIIGIDHRGRILEFNAAAEAIFGYAREGAMGKDLAELIIPERLREAHRTGMTQYLKSGAGPVLGKRLELPAVRLNGEEFPAEVSIQAEATREGPIFVAYIRDVTEQRQAEADLREAKDRAEAANAVKSEFLAMMSHEIRTPINAVIGTLSLLQDTKLDEEQANFTRTGRRASEALLNIINDILDFSKMEAGKLVFDAAPFKLRDIVETVGEVISPRAEGKGIWTKIVLSDRLPAYLIGDEGRIRQILLNLAGNAVKFTDEGGVTIEVSLIEENPHEASVRFDVINTGIGISPEHHRDLFGEFTTLTPAYTQKFGGTGLGLAISKSLVEMMDGDIGFESALGAGSRFWFSVTLPKLSADATAAVEASVRNTEDFRNIALSGTILLAEDNPANQMVTRTVLEKAGLRVDIAANGLEAVAAVRRRPYDLILMDIGMPELDGIGAMEQIKALDPERARIPIIAMTAHVMRGDRSALLAKGMDGYLAKPASREQLLGCVIEWLHPDGAAVPETTLPQTAEPATSQADAVVDEAALVQLGEDTDPSLLPQLIQTFVTTAEKQIGVIAAAAAKGDCAKVGAEAHSLKSSAATFGARHLNALAKELELAGKNGDLETVEKTVPLIEVEGPAAIQWLRNHAAGIDAEP